MKISYQGCHFGLCFFLIPFTAVAFIGKYSFRALFKHAVNCTSFWKSVQFPPIAQSWVTCLLGQLWQKEVSLFLKFLSYVTFIWPY